MSAAAKLGPHQTPASPARMPTPQVDRQDRPRGRSLGLRPLRRSERAFAEELRRLPVLPSRPTRRAECVGVPRPCPFVSCAYNLFADETRAGAARLNFPHLEPGDMPANGSCALDVAEEGGLSLEDVGDLMGLTLQRVSQIQRSALMKVRDAAIARELAGSDASGSRARVATPTPEDPR